MASLSQKLEQQPTDSLALKRPSPPCLGHLVRANHRRLQSLTAAAFRWISQSSPDRPDSLVNPTARRVLDSALQALDDKYMSQMS